MSEQIRQVSASRRNRVQLHRAQPGQTLVVALAVLFILLFVGGAFVVNVARNLANSRRGSDTSGALALAQAGLKYCDEELTGSVDGADWRPIPSAPIGPNNGVQDPDYFWLEKGFTRLNLKGGRALVRVSYDPDPFNPVGQAIKIESIGRTGELDPNDPTVFVQNNTSPRLRRELIAYKRIGFTDYLRYMTDKDKGNHTNYIGVPAVGHFFPMVFGNPMLAMNSYTGGVSGNETLYGGSVYCNANLTIMGDTLFYEGSRGVNDATMANSGDPARVQEGIFAAGVITANQTTPASPTATRFDAAGNPITQAMINVAPDGTTPSSAPGSAPFGGPITPTFTAAGTPNPNFETYGGLYRDGSTDPDRSGVSRGVSRFTPASIDTKLNGTGSLRIRQITQLSGNWTDQNFNTGMHGWGKAIYIDNTADLQPETMLPGVNGGYSLPADWTNPNAGFAQSAWQGPYYRPPGVLIELLGDRMRITRTDGKSFYASNGTANAQNGGSTMEIPFSDLERGMLPTPAGQPPIAPFPHDGDEAVTGTDPRNSSKFSIDPGSYGVNIVLFAEGNIRVKGVYGSLTDTTKPAPKLSRVHLTLVTGGTGYIEGNLVAGDGTVSGSGGAVQLQRNSTCQIICKDYVCVNTSMFMQPQNQTNVWSRVTPDVDAFATEIGLPRTWYDTTFSNGVFPGSYMSNGTPVQQMLNLRHTALAPGPTAINMFVNPALDNVFSNKNAPQQGNSLFQWPFNINNTPTSTTSYPLGTRPDPNNNNLVVPDPSSVTPYFEQKTFVFDGNPASATFDTDTYNVYPGYDNLLRLNVDQTAQAAQTNIAQGPLQSYLLSAIMVSPLDIRIEAGLYAQEKSFFIIPGYSFNPDPNDTRSNFRSAGSRASYGALDTTAGNNNDRDTKNKFPYHNEPLDVRITFQGAIAESYTASVGAQAAWLKQWGYTPAKYGSYNAATPTTTEIPDDHLFARSPGPNGTLPNGYVAGDPGNLDFRTPVEKTVGENDFLLTRALRFEYDPKFAMPYFHSTDKTLTGQQNRNMRLGRALRFLNRTINYGTINNPVNFTFRQMLPPMPRLPLSPDLIYSGQSDQLLGENPYDTDFYQ